MPWRDELPRSRRPRSCPRPKGRDKRSGPEASALAPGSPRGRSSMSRRHRPRCGPARPHQPPRARACRPRSRLRPWNGHRSNDLVARRDLEPLLSRPIASGRQCRQSSPAETPRAGAGGGCGRSRGPRHRARRRHSSTRHWPRPVACNGRSELAMASARDANAPVRPRPAHSSERLVGVIVRSLVQRLGMKRHGYVRTPAMSRNAHGAE